MPTTNIKTGWFYPGNMLKWVYDTRVAALQNGYTVQALVLGATDGYRSASWTQIKGGSTENYFAVLYTLASTQEAPASWFLRSYNWYQSTSAYYSTAAGGPSWTTVLTRFQQNYVAYKAALIDNWSPSFISSQRVTQISYAGDRGRSACVDYTITTDTEAFVDVSNLQAYNDNISPSTPFGDQQQPANVNQVASIVMPTQALDSIAESLSDIAMADYEISLNHGQSIFSVRGKVTT